MLTDENNQNMRNV